MAIARTKTATLLENTYAVCGVEKCRYTICLANGNTIPLRTDDREEAVMLLTKHYM